MIADRTYRIDHVDPTNQWSHYIVKIAFEKKTESHKTSDYRWIKATPNQVAIRVFDSIGQEHYSHMRNIVRVNGRVTEAKLIEIADNLEFAFLDHIEPMITPDIKVGDKANFEQNVVVLTKL
jgi:hypothetical protein